MAGPAQDEIQRYMETQQMRELGAGELFIREEQLRAEARAMAAGQRRQIPINQAEQAIYRGAAMVGAAAVGLGAYQGLVALNRGVPAPPAEAEEQYGPQNLPPHWRYGEDINVGQVDVPVRVPSDVGSLTGEAPYSYGSSAVPPSSTKSRSSTRYEVPSTNAPSSTASSGRAGAPQGQPVWIPPTEPYGGEYVERRPPPAQYQPEYVERLPNPQEQVEILREQVAEMRRQRGKEELRAEREAFGPRTEPLYTTQTLEPWPVPTSQPPPGYNPAHGS